MKGGWVYIVTNKRDGVLYVGVTSDLLKRAWEHREGVVAGFTKRYGLKLLVYFEWHDEITLAIQREKNIKHWSRLEDRAHSERESGLEGPFRDARLERGPSSGTRCPGQARA